MLLPHSRSYSGFEPLLDDDEKRQIQLQQLRRKVLLTFFTFSLMGLLLAKNLQLGSITEPTFGMAAPPQDHTIPTILSIVDPDSGKYVNSLENKLYHELKNVQMMEHRFLRQTESLPILSLDKTEIKRLRESLTLSWTLGESQAGHALVDDSDIVALYCPHDSDHSSFLEAATVKQITATSRKHGGSDYNQEWFIPSFPISKHESCQFRLFDRQDTATLQLLATSPVLSIPAASRTPTGIHLAYSENPTEMVIQFNTAEKGTPIAMLGDTKVDGASHTYTAKDLCGEPANSTEVGKFQEPGMFHVIRLTGLEPNREYTYKVGLASGQGIVWSDEYTFLSAPPVGYMEEPISIVAYGDQGCPSVGWGDGGLWTSAMASREKGIRAVHHYGDLSYAQGAAHVWDEWLHMIESFATHVPIMVGVGNHEYDHLIGGSGGKDPSGVEEDHGFMPEWGNFGSDSGGECGVPTSQRFTMPVSNNSNGVFWYSHELASIHTVMLSSEHNMTKGSPQYEWFVADLKKVNRTLTPWLIVELHRPLYQSEFFWSNNAVGVAMRYEIEDVLQEYKVDLVLAGHYHSYLRTCDGLYRSKCNNGGPMHICVGSAGAHLDMALLYPQQWTEVFIEQEWGYGRITVQNASALHYEFVKAGADGDPSAGKIRDDVWLIRDR
jgi:hypothetical protein